MHQVQGTYRETNTLATKSQPPPLKANKDKMREYDKIKYDKIETGKTDHRTSLGLFTLIFK